jgi:hypothetical protein
MEHTTKENNLYWENGTQIKRTFRFASLDDFKQFRETNNIEELEYKDESENSDYNHFLEDVEWDENFPTLEILNTIYPVIDIHFESDEKHEEFLSNITHKKSGQGCWIPYKPEETIGGKHLKYVGENLPTKYPLYIISYKRSDTRYTQKKIHEMGIPYKIVVESFEYDKYKEHIPEENILCFTRDECDKDKGSIPVRNFVWEHSIQQGHKRHWIVDDNIKGFYRWCKNIHVECNDSSCFRQVEDLTDRYSNVYMSGIQYKSMCPQISRRRKIITKNSKVFSCCLYDNFMDVKLGLDDRWRGKYNEDIDLILRILKKGGMTLQIQNFLINKPTSKTVKGGNAEEIYKMNGWDLMKVNSLIEQHPDCVIDVPKFGKKHHHEVNYKKVSTCDTLELNVNHIQNEIKKDYGLELVEMEKEVKVKKVRKKRVKKVK